MTQFIATPFHDVDINDIMLSKTLADALERNFPGYGWMVRAFSEPNGGVIEIKSAWVQSHVVRPVSHIIKYENLVNTYDMTRNEAVRAGGEMLERCSLPRTRFGGHEVKFIDGVEKKFLYSTYSGMLV